jgi:hypothetical protein
MPVTTLELEEYKAFRISTWHALADRLRYSVPNRQLPAVPWDYPTGANLISIIEKGELWSTQIACLNDFTELSYATELYRAAVAQRVYAATSVLERRCGEEVLRRLVTDERRSNQVFVTCFSAYGDDLSQWRAYAGGENGYVLGFDTQSLLRIAESEHSSHLCPVVYDEGVQLDFVTFVANETFRFFMEGLARNRTTRPDEWAGDFIPVWGQTTARKPAVTRSLVPYQTT